MIRIHFAEGYPQWLGCAPSWSSGRKTVSHLITLIRHRMECQRIQPWYATMAWCPLTFINLALSKVTATNGRDALQIVAYSVDWNLTSPMGHAFLNVIFFAFWYPPALKHQEQSMARKRMHKRVSKMPCYFFIGFPIAFLLVCEYVHSL